MEKVIPPGRTTGPSFITGAPFAPETPRFRLRRWLAGLLLATVTALVFTPSLRNEFLIYDDDTYITQNHRVTGGITAGNLRWALLSTDQANWHPLTWIVHQAVATGWGLRPWGHHLASLLLHAIAVFLLFAYLARATGAPGAALFAAALFALHPLRVESVAWAAELKDPLSGVLFMLALHCHARHAVTRKGRDYLALLLASSLGLLAKPMLVTLPLVLLLLDHWPLHRWSRPAALRLVLEKTPLLLLSLAVGLVTVFAQSSAGALRSIGEFPLAIRLQQAPVAAASYLALLFRPVHLSAYYPHPGGSLPVAEAAGAGAVLLAITVYTLLRHRRRPYLAVGWFWFLLTMAPVSGIAQVGLQGMADRYTYLPLIGVGIMLSWGGREIVRTRRSWRAVLPAAAAGFIVILSILTTLRIGVWHDTERLFRDALVRDPGNWFAHLKVAEALRIQHRTAEALEHARRAAAAAPRHPNPMLRSGILLGESGRFTEAEAQFREALRLEPGWTEALHNLGLALHRQGRHEEALVPLREELRAAPGHVPALMALGVVLLAAGRLEEAETRGRTWLHVEPRSPLAFILLARISEARGDVPRALERYRSALALDAGLSEARAGIDRLDASHLRHP